MIILVLSIISFTMNRDTESKYISELIEKHVNPNELNDLLIEKFSIKENASTPSVSIKDSEDIDQIISLISNIELEKGKHKDGVSDNWIMLTFFGDESLALYSLIITDRSEIEGYDFETKKSEEFTSSMSPSDYGSLENFLVEYERKQAQVPMLPQIKH